MSRPRDSRWVAKIGTHILGYIEAISRSDARSALQGWFGYSHQLRLVAVHGNISELTPILITKKRKAEIRAKNEQRFGMGWNVVDLGIKP